MNTLRLARVLLPALMLLALAAPAATAATARVQAILITASQESGGRSDPRLAAYEATLRRVLRFNSFTFQGSDGDTLAAGGKVTLVIGQGHELDLTAGENPLHVRVRWADKVGGRTHMTTGLRLNPGVPAVLGGPPTERGAGEVYAVILIAR